MARDLNSSEEEYKLLGSGLQQWKLLALGTKISEFRNKRQIFVNYFTMEEKMCFCIDVNGLKGKLEVMHKPDNWQLFIFFEV